MWRGGWAGLSPVAALLVQIALNARQNITRTETTNEASQIINQWCSMTGALHWKVDFELRLKQ